MITHATRLIKWEVPSGAVIEVYAEGRGHKGRRQEGDGDPSDAAHGMAVFLSIFCDSSVMCEISALFCCSLIVFFLSFSFSLLASNLILCLLSTPLRLLVLEFHLYFNGFAMISKRRKFSVTATLISNKLYKTTVAWQTAWTGRPVDKRAIAYNYSCIN